MGDAALFERVHDGERSRVLPAAEIAKSLQGDGQVPLGLAALGFEPELPGLAQEKVERRLVRRRNRQVLQEETPPVKPQRIRGARDVVFGMRRLQNARVFLSHLGIQMLQRTECATHGDIHAEVPKAAKAGGNVQRHVLRPPAAREPRPGTVGKLHLGQPFERRLGFGVQAVLVEKNADVAPGLALGLGLPQPRGFFDHHRFDILVFLERTVESGRVLPLVEDAADSRVAVGDEPGQGVGVEPVKGLLAALVRVFHEVGQRQHGVPGGVGGHLRCEALAAQRLGFAGRDEVREREAFGGRPANGQGQRFRHQDPP